MFDQIDAFLSVLEKLQKYSSKKTEPDSVASRFIRLFEKHGVHRNQIPRFFDHGLTLADVADDDKLLGKLTPDILNDAAVLFAIRLEWLEGVDAQIYETHDFYKHPEDYREFLSSVIAGSEHHVFAEVVWSINDQCREDTLLVLKETIAEHGNESIERYHLCSNWLSKYWKSRADLAACIAITENQRVFLKGEKTSGDITEFCQGKRFIADLTEQPNAFKRDWLFRKRYQPWEPDQWLYNPNDYLDGIDEGDFGKAAALSRWLENFERGYMETAHPKDHVKAKFLSALEKYKQTGHE